MATEGDNLSFAWPHCYGSNSGRILNSLADTREYASRTADLNPPILEEKKVREIFDSLLQESDLRSCQTAFPAHMDEEARMEQDPLDDPDDEDEAAETRADRTPLDVPGPDDDDMKPMGPHLDKQAE